MLLEEFVELVPVVELPLQAEAVVVAAHLDVAHVVAREDLGDQEAIREVAPHILDRVREVEPLEPLEELAGEALGHRGEQRG